MRMGVEDADDRQAKILNVLQNAFVSATRVHHDRPLRDRITDDRAVAAQRRHRKGFDDHSVFILSPQRTVGK